MTKTSIPWARFGFESVLIISSILAALAVDSWWQNHRQRDDEQQVLASLLSEFEQNKVELERALNSLTVSREAANALLAFAGKNFIDSDRATVERRMSELYLYYTFDPASGALDSLLSAGQLELITDIELRSELAGWSGRIRDYKEEEREVDFVAYRELVQYLRAVAPLPIVEEMSPGRFEPHWQSAFADLEFLNMLGHMSIATDNAILEASVIMRNIERVIALIKAERRSD